MNSDHRTDNLVIGVVGIGLMGSSIVVNLLLAGHKVKAIAPIREDYLLAPERIKDNLAHAAKFGLLTCPEQYYYSRLTISEDYEELRDCRMVAECVMERSHIKNNVYARIVKAVDKETIIASNTSAIPISSLQKMVDYPERFMGVHWAEPAYATRFLEIVPGENTDPENIEWMFQLAYLWKKEPILLKKDIRGFITNRLMYSVYREAFSLVSSGRATFEEIDKAFRYDAGSWITLMGIFRRMDFIGLHDLDKIFNNIFPLLSNSESIPPVMEEMIAADARGVHNAKGLYPYTEEEIKAWNDAFALFNKDIYHLTEEYTQAKIDLVSRGKERAFF
ncbi:MAG: 3-hydroxyacyl-CoA dehydrogenase family protein [Chitinophagaceae bacterium]|nr:3-hydroxyacyl-CoA dehydrogenase family protein [Chitinophagaceae bacterium]